MGDKIVAIFTKDELAALLATRRGGGFQNRRDCAVISLFKDTGVRLSELASLAVADVSPAKREAVVTGKGDKHRTARFTCGTAQALDRYLRERARHPMTRVSALWLGVPGGPMTASGVYQKVERRGHQLVGVLGLSLAESHHSRHGYTRYHRRRYPQSLKPSLFTVLHLGGLINRPVQIVGG